VEKVLGKEGCVSETEGGGEGLREKLFVVRVFMVR